MWGAFMLYTHWKNFLILLKALLYLPFRPKEHV